MNLDGYEFIEKISGNTNSETWRARKQDSDKTVSIKVLDRNSIDTEYYGTIIQNANNTRELPHTNIVNIYEIIEQEEHTYFVYENINGKTIKETVEKNGPIQEKTALTIALCVAGMLESAHRKKYLSHGNISPSSIIIDKEGTVKLAGLGLPFDKTERSFFTAPEQTADTHQNALSDMYSMGTTIYYMLTAKESFTEDDTVSSISDQTAEIITRLTRTHTDDRYTTWKEALTDIEAAASILPNTTSLPPITGINEAVPSEQTEQEAAQSQKTKNQATVPLWFRALAWLLLFGFLGWFTYRQLNNPIIDKNKILGREQSDTTVADNTTTTEPVQANVQQEENPQEILNNIKNQMITAILANDINTARQAVSDAATPEIKEETDKLLELVDIVSNPDTYLASIFGDSIGENIVIMFGNTRREIVPIAISGLNITAKLANENDSEEVTFSLKELPIKEKLRLLGTKTDETSSIIKLLLNVKDGNIHEAKTLARSCGSLADALTEQLNNK